MRYSGANHRADLGLRRNEEVRVHVPLSTKPQAGHRGPASHVIATVPQLGHAHSAGGSHDDGLGRQSTRSVDVASLAALIATHPPNGAQGPGALREVERGTRLAAPGVASQEALTPESRRTVLTNP
jgi:hypothetical protein